MSGDREQEALLAEARKFEDQYRASCLAAQTRYGPTLIGRLTDLCLAERALRVQAQEHANTLTSDVYVLADKLKRAEQERGEAVANAGRWLTKAERAGARASELEQALTEIHEFQCGCDKPGRLDVCVARPSASFSALAGVAETKEPRADANRGTNPKEEDRRAPCPSCGLLVITTGDGRFPCSWCGAPLPSADSNVDTNQEPS